MLFLTPQKEGQPKPILPFYHLVKKTGKPTKEMIGTRAILLELAKSGTPSNRYQLGQRLEVEPHSLLNYLRALRRVGALELKTEQRPSQTTSLYSLTAGGKCVALAISLASDNPKGLDHTALVREIVQEIPRTTPFNRFGAKYYELLVQHHREDLIMDVVRRSVENVFMNGLTEFFKALFTTGPEVAKAQFDSIHALIVQALSELSAEDANMVKLFMKQSIEFTMLIAALTSKDTKFIDVFKGRILDVESVYIPFKCEVCQHTDPQMEVKIHEVLASMVTMEGIRCKACHRRQKLKSPLFTMPTQSAI